MADETLKHYSRIQPGDDQKMREARLAILDMVRAKIEAGEVESLAVLIVAKDPLVSGGNAYTGSRFLVKPAHLDLIEDVFHQMMGELAKAYGVTAAEIREERATVRKI